MLRDAQAGGRQIRLLSPLVRHDRRFTFFQRRLAGGADSGAMLHYHIRRRHQPERLAGMAQWSARLLAAASAQAARLAG